MIKIEKDMYDKKAIYKRFYERHKERVLTNSRKWNENNKERVYEIGKNSKFKKRYGITLEEYNVIFEKQNGYCAICNKHQFELKKALNVDHDHITNKIRGLLCWSCNVALGKFNEDSNLLNKAINYLNNK